MDGAGKIAMAEWIEAPDDQDAVRQAHHLKLHAPKGELWQKQRLVATLTAPDLTG
jgi:hypothetical protein